MKATIILSMASLALVATVMTGCSAEDNTIDIPQQPENKNQVVTLTTTVGFDEGAAVRGTHRALSAAGVKTFSAGETMALVYKNTSGTTVKVESAALTAGDIATGGKSATFTFELANPDRTKDVTYIYPAAMAKSDGSVNYDALATQDGTLATLSSNLDLATNSAAWDGSSLPTATLDNPLAILALTLKNNNGTSDITGTITGITLSDGTNSYRVTRTAAAGPVYVAIRPTASASIALTATNGSAHYTKSLTGKTYAAGNGYSLSLKMSVIGLFSVESGTKVYFASGNLQATYNGDTWTWGFAANQWDYIGNAAGNTKVTATSPYISENATVDLFGWVGASSSFTGVAQYGITSSTSTNNDNGYGNVATEDLKSDWGETIGSDWRTLTSAEWAYIFNTRASGSIVNGTNEARYTHATINTDGTAVNGMILFPDGITVAASEATSWGTVNGNSDWGTKCTTAQWTALAAKGCVFLPAAGFRNGTSVTRVSSYGYYWSSSPYTTLVNSAYDVFFYSGVLNPAYGGRNYGVSVRLVRDVK